LPEGEGGASGFSPGPNQALGQRDGRGLGIAGAGGESGGREVNGHRDGEVEEESKSSDVIRVVCDARLTQLQLSKRASPASRAESQS
jgi:hypothetical protein